MLAQLETAWELVRTFWIVPLGAVALYYYGWYHFNSPDYPLELKPVELADHSTNARLLTLAPPIYTIPRSVFRWYAIRYIALLEGTFLVITLLPTLVSDIASILDLNFSQVETQSVQYRAVWALFALTGLLSSFPVFRDVDQWILKRLHAAAVIPDGARFLANKLFDCNFTPSDRARADVRNQLTMRDTQRVSDGTAHGKLELAILRALWLKHQLHSATSSARNSRFRLKIEKDLNDIAKTANILEEEIKQTLKQQEGLVPDTVTDIDIFLHDNRNNEALDQLSKKREELIDKLDYFYFRICLVAALFAYSSARRRDVFGPILRDLGFEVVMFPRPVVDWDAIVKIFLWILLSSTISIIIIQLILQYLESTNLDLSGGADTSTTVGILYDESRIPLILGSTIPLALTIYFSTKIKRLLHRYEDFVHGSENVITAFCCYLLGVAMHLGIIIIENSPTLSFSVDVLFLPLDIGILSYFICIYLDRAQRHEGMSYKLVLVQSFAIFLAGIIYYYFAAGFSQIFSGPSTYLVVNIGQMVMVTINSLVIGISFQYLYERNQPPQEAGEATRVLKVAGDAVL